MKRAILFGTLLATASSAQAANTATVPLKPLTTLPTQALSLAKPDLAITKLAVDSNCRIVVTVVNNGPGALPDSVWTVKTPASSSVYITVAGKGWGGGTIWSFDSAQNLKKAGGGATYVSSYVVQGSVSVQATVDPTAQVAQTNEGKHQVELAQSQYALPRLTGRGVEMMRLGAGIGTRARDISPARSASGFSSRLHRRTSRS